ncbi:MAG: glycosyltransferase [Anaerohalosphaeraceae bacterium]|jgi:glycosyltransferase involved in cell wall biosynthesis
MRVKRMAPATQNKENRITVAMLWPTYRDGPHTSVEEMAQHLDPNRFRLITIFLKQKENYKSRHVVAGRTMYCLSDKKRLTAFSFPIARDLMKVLKEEGVDILHCHRHKACFYGALARRYVPRTVVLLHVHGIGRTKNAGRKMLNRFMFSQADRVIGCAESVRLDILRANPWAPESKIIALRNSVEFERFAGVRMEQAEARRTALPGVPANAFLCGMVARFGPHKGHCHLIRALAQVRKSIPHVHLVLAGTGELEQAVRDQVRGEKLSDCVHFLGYRRDVPRIMRALDLFILPSVDSEGMPLVLLEAMASGTPCVATRLSGIPEVIDSDEVGRLVPVGDERALAAAISDVARMPAADIQRMAVRAQERIRDHFSHSVVVRELAAIYEDAYGRAWGRHVGSM